jgi:GNAT superfamily N-acetyltransferase
MNTDELVQLRFNRPHAWSLPTVLETRNALGSVTCHVEYGARQIIVDNDEVRMGQVAWVCTDPVYAGRGLATGLLRALLDIASYDNCDYVGLFADIPRFYERIGFMCAPNLGEFGMVAVIGDRAWSWNSTVDLRGDLW